MSLSRKLCSALRPSASVSQRGDSLRLTAQALCASALLSTTLLGCGPELDRISVLSQLRILGLKKSAPYARPGEEVDLHLFWEDSGQKKPRPVERFIGFWCVNPAGGTFSDCLNEKPSVIPQFVFNEDTTKITIPEDSVRPSLTDPRLPPSGQAFVFYGVCAGRLSLDGKSPLSDSSWGGAPPESTETFEEQWEGLETMQMPTCLDEAGEPLGSEHFIMGYSVIQIYEKLRNAHPRITGFELGGKKVAVDCLDEECVGRPFALPELSACEPGVACLDSCEDDGKSTCPRVPFRAVVDRKSAEKDAVAYEAYGTDVEESIWISYFVDRGMLEADVRLVNDSERGWIDDYRGQLFAPREKGPLRIWAVVRDNRGGVSWARVPAYVR